MKKPAQILTASILFSLFYLGFPAYCRQSIAVSSMSAGLEDMFFRFRHSSDPLPANADSVVIVSIDDESSQKLNARWPWSRKLFAELVEVLTERGAHVVALNFSFNGLEDDAETTIRLAEAIRKHGRVVVGATLDNQKLLKPNEMLVQAGGFYGYLEKIVDDDYVIRRSYLARAFTGMTRHWELSFPLRILTLATEESSRPSVDELIHRAADAEGQYRINFLMDERNFKKVPAWKILENRSSDTFLKGKVVFVGITSSLLAEKHTTPLGFMSGVLVHANEYVSLSAQRYLRELPAGLVDFASWIFSLTVFILILTRRWWLGIIAAGVTLFLTFLAAQSALSQDLIIRPFILLAGPGIALVMGVVVALLILFLEKRGLENKVVHDKMTGLYTYDYLRGRLDEEWKRSLKMQTPVSVVMTDLDRFKRINDALGHEIGNQMILRAAEVIKKSVRGYDVVARYGGDEFVILLWHSNVAEAVAYRDRLRSQFEQMAALLQEPLLRQSSISIGTASFDPKNNATGLKSPQELVEAADKNLFQDKESRRKPG